MKRNQIVVLVLAFLFGCAAASAFGETVTVVKRGPAVVEATVDWTCPNTGQCQCVGKNVPVGVNVVRQYRPYRGVYVAAPRAVVSVERRTPTYTVVEEPREPVVIRGLFTDRVRIPRGKQITIEKHERQ